MADFRITVRIDPTGAQRGARQVRRELGSIDSAADRTRRLIAQAFTGAALTAGLTSTIRLLAGFEQEMSTVRAVTGATTAQFTLLREEAQRLGTTTRFSASQAAEGMTFLARAGFNTNEVLSATEQTLTLAQAGALDLASAADIASNVLQGFNIQADESGRVVDVLALAANSANTNVEQLGQAMSFVAPAAASVGISLESTAAAIGALSDAGIQATRAGTGLRQIFIELQDSGDALLNVSQRGLVPVLETLRDRQIDLSTATDLVGARQASALLVLTRSIPKIRELADEFDNAEGAAARIAEIMDDNLNGAILATRSALEGLILEIGDSGATGAFEAFFRGLASGLRAMTAEIQTVVNVLETIIILLGVTFARVAIGAAIAGIRALNVAIATNPIGALVTALTLAVSAFIAFADQMELTAGSSATVLDFLIVVFERFASFVQFAFTVVAAALSGFQDDLDNFDFLTFVRTAARGTDVLIGIFEGAFDGIKAIFEDFPRVMGDIIITGLNFILDKSEDFVNGIIDALNSIPGVAIESLDGVIPQLENPFEGAAEGVGQAALRGFVRGFNRSLARNFVEDVATEAEQRAAERAARQAEERAALEAARAGLGASGAGGVGDNGSGGSAARAVEGLNDRNAALAREIQLLDQEAEILRLVGDEREVLSAQLQVEEELRRILREANEELTEEQINNLARLSEPEAEAIERAVLRNLELERQARILDDIRGPQMQYEQGLQALNTLLEEGAISIEEYNDQLRGLRISALSELEDMASGFERGLLRIQDEFTDTATVAEDLFVNAFRGAEDALVDFVQTGKLEVGDLIDSITNDISRLAVREGITGPLAEALGIGGGGGGGGLFGGLGSLFGGGGKGGFSLGSIFGGGKGGGFLGSLGSIFGNISGGFGSFFSSIGSIFGSLPFFENGGQFDVAGFGGVDRNLLSINNQPVARVSRGETVSVSPNGGSGGGVTVNMYIQTPDADSFRRSQGQILSDARRQMDRASRRNN